MYLKPITKNGVTRLYFYESYYENKKTRSRLVESLGRFDDLSKLYHDPILHFKKIAEERTIENKQEKIYPISINMDTTLGMGEHNFKNVGYGIIKRLYRELELEKFWNWKTKGRQFEYSAEQIFRLLVFSRVLFPGSKKYTYENKSIFFESFEGFTLDAIYDTLDFFADNQEALQKWIYDHSARICERDFSVSYFDCTNYYFDIGRPDSDTLDENGKPVDKNGNPAAAKYRKRGAEKNKRPDPIVQMGLLTDRNGIPLAYDIFPGNESEKVHMRPIINRVKNEFLDTRIIFVADRGLNTSDNIYFLNGDNKGGDNQRDGYVYGQSIRGADKEFKAWVLGGKYYVHKVKEDDGEEIIFRHKSRTYPKEINVNVTVPGNRKKRKKTVRIDQKQMVYYSEKYAKKQRMDRQVMIERAKDLIKYPKKYDKVTSAGSAAYILNIAFDKTTGEIIEGRSLKLDLDKIREEALYDGYYSIVTSELKMSDLQMREVYRGLARIEDTFKISKSDFETRPIYVRTNNHIDAHFLTCFVALVLIRLLQAKLNSQYPVGQIIRSLRKYSCTKIDVNMHQFLYYDEIIKSCEAAFDIELCNMYLSQDQVRRLLKY